MEKRDFRKLTSDAQLEIKKAAIKMVKAGQSQEYVAEFFGINRKTLYTWLKQFEEKGPQCVFRSIRHPIPALFGSLIRSEATHWFKYTKGAGSGGSFPHRFSFQFDFIPVMKQSVANGIS